VIATAPQPAVLHLVSAPSSTRGHRPALGRQIPTYLCAQAIEQGLTPPGRVVLIGDSSSETQARALGLSPSMRFAPPLGRVSMLARTIRALSRSASRVICWSDELTPLLRGINAPIDLISTHPALAARRVSNRVGVRVFERCDRDAWESRNHQAELESVLNPLLQNPPAFPNAPLRSALGIESDQVCIGVIADQPSTIDARSVGFLMGLLNVAGFNVSVVIPQGAAHLDSARRHHHTLGSHFRMLISSNPMLSMLPVFDVLIHPSYDGSGSSMLIERLCENADVPVLRLRHSGREGLSRAPGVAAPIIEALDDIIAQRQPDPLRREVEVHV